MIYILENTDLLGDAFLSAALPELSLQRLRKIDSLKIKSDRINSAAVYLLLRYALKNEYNITEAVDFTFGKHGKPYIEKHPDIFFSLSHCRNACACIIDSSETAIDIMDRRRISMRTAQYFCTDGELKKVSELSDPSEELVKLWTKKECYSKLDGSGLLMDFRTVTGDVISQVNLEEGDRYFAAYFGEAHKTIVRLSADELLSV